MMHETFAFSAPERDFTCFVTVAATPYFPSFFSSLLAILSFAPRKYTVCLVQRTNGDSW